MEFETVIGLEVHAQLSTQTKIFCSCATSFGAPANQNTCPVCLGLPGALPVLNRHAVELAVTLGLALDCQIQETSVWDRKNYFYQDLPKGYQISQFSRPICLGGSVEIELDGKRKKLPLTRIHMEEDAGKSLHDGADERYSQVDLNRAGIPLCEIVSEPDMRSAEEAGAYLRSLRSIVRYAGVCDGNMEQGSFRCDANVSIRPIGQKEFGTKVELKNLNSIRFVEKAIKYEVERQRALIMDGKLVQQETRLFNPDKGVTESMRSKENAHDYRYFPDPDLVPLVVDKVWIQSCRDKLPELAQQKQARFVRAYQITEYDAAVLTADKAVADYFELALQLHDSPKKIANWIISELMREMKTAEVEIDECPIQPAQLAQLIKLIDGNVLSGKMAKDVFKEMFVTGKDPEAIIKEKNLVQVSDTSAIESVIAEIMAANPSQVEEFRSGKEKVFGFFVGQVMRAMKGQGNPQMVNDLLRSKLKG